MEVFSLEQKIVHHLLLQSPFVREMGLLYGKMGISIFFFEYGKYLNNNVYTDYGNEILDEVLKNLNLRMPNNFSIGLAGIGWGWNICYRIIL